MQTHIALGKYCHLCRILKCSFVALLNIAHELKHELEHLRLELGCMCVMYLYCSRFDCGFTLRIELRTWIILDTLLFSSNYSMQECFSTSAFSFVMSKIRTGSAGWSLTNL